MLKSDTVHRRETHRCTFRKIKVEKFSIKIIEFPLTIHEMLITDR